MKKSTILMILALGMMSGGFYHDAFAMNATEQNFDNQQRQERVLTIEDAKNLIEDMKNNGSTELKIQDGYTSIDSFAFCRCKELTSVTIPASVTSIGASAFRECKGLRSISIPENVTYIEKLAFSRCYKLTSISLPDKLTFIGDRAFYECKGLTSISILNGVTHIEDEAFYGCSCLTSVKIPDSVKSIGCDAFKGCTRLKSITIPDSVIRIEDDAFEGCRNARFIIPNIEGMKKYLKSYHNIAEENIEIDKNARKANEWVWEADGNIIIPNGIESIGDAMFKCRYDIKSFKIPDSVTSIGNLAFYRCIGLTYITIPNRVKSIARRAFAGCDGLTSVTIPDSVTSIGEGAFAGCEGLTSVTIPDSVTSIDYAAFYGCYNLNKIYVYSDRVKQLVIDSKSVKNPCIIEVRPLHQQYLKQKAKFDAYVKQRQDEKIAYRENNPEFVDLAEVKSEDGQWLDRDVQKDDEERIKKEIARLKKINERNKK